MLYRPVTRAARLATAFRAALGAVTSAIAGFRKSGADTAYVESASEDLLRDIGARRPQELPDPWRMIR